MTYYYFWHYLQNTTIEEKQTVKKFPFDLLSILTLSFTDLLKNVKHIAIIDLENQPHLAKLSSLPSNVLIFGVYGHLSPLATQDIIFPCYVVKSAIRDAADHGVSFLAGILTSSIVYSESKAIVYIVSRDHFAEASVECFRSANIDARHLPQLSESELFSFV